MNPIAEFVKKSRKEAGLTQEEFAMRSGLGLRFVRDLTRQGTVPQDRGRFYTRQGTVPQDRGRFYALD